MTDAPKQVDIEKEFWRQIVLAAKDSPWIDQDNYTANDIVSDVCEFLRKPRTVADELAEALKAIAKQPLQSEGADGDFEYAYDKMVSVARIALAKYKDQTND